MKPDEEVPIKDKEPYVLVEVITIEGTYKTKLPDKSIPKTHYKNRYVRWLEQHSFFLDNPHNKILSVNVISRHRYCIDCGKEIDWTNWHPNTYSPYLCEKHRKRKQKEDTTSY